MSRPILLASAAVAALLICDGTLAQTAPQQSPPPGPIAATPPADNGAVDAGANGIADIIVTASRRSATAQRTAIPITALSSADLKAQGVVNIVEVTKLAPAVKIGQAASGAVQITIRGVGTFGGNNFAEPGVAINLDGVYLARPSAAEGIFYDVDRVEILKGPQGTLYGRNSTGGVVNVLTNDPTDKLGGELNAGIGNYRLRQISGALNVPITRGVALRVAGQRVDRDGYLSDGYSDDNNYAARAKLKLDPTSRLSILLEADYVHNGGRGAQSVFVPYVDPSDPYIGPSDPRSNAVVDNAALPPPIKAVVPRTLTNGYLNNRAWGYQGTANYDLGFATATLVLAERKNTNDYLHYAAGVPVSEDIRGHPSDTKTAEFRLGSKSGGPLKWVVGAFYFDDDQHAKVAFDQGLTFVAPDEHVRTKSYSGFGEATYSISDRLRLTAGGRYTSDDKGISGYTISPLLGAPALDPVACPAALGATITPGPLSNPAMTNVFRASCRAPVSGSATFNKFTYKVGVEADVGARSLIYATYATGFKAGGFYGSLNVAPAGSFPSNGYRPENLTAYTVGAKNRFLDNKLQINIEGFYWDYKDKQISHIGVVQPGNNLSLVVDNAAGARIYGAELESLWQPTPHDAINFGVQYLHSRYKSYVYNAIVTGYAFSPLATPATGCAFTPVAGLGGAPGGLGVPGVSTVDCSGKRVSFSPRFVINAGYRHTFDLADGSTIVAAASTHYESNFALGEEYLPGQIQKAKSVSNVDLTWNSPSRKYSVTGYVQNIEDSAVGQSSFVHPVIGRPNTVLGAPRTYGVRGTVRF